MQINKKILFIIFIVGISLVCLYFTRKQVLPLELITKDKKLLKHIKGANYFPQDAFSSYEVHDKFLSAWFGLHLNSMNEKSLWKLAQEKKDELVARLLYLPTFSRPYVIRVEVEKVDKNGILILKGTDGDGGYHDGRIIINEQYKLQLEEVSNLMGRMQRLTRNNNLQRGGG